MTDYLCTNCGQPAVPPSRDSLTGQRPEAERDIHRRDARTIEELTRCQPNDPDSPTCQAVPAGSQADLIRQYNQAIQDNNGYTIQRLRDEIIHEMTKRHIADNT